MKLQPSIQASLTRMQQQQMWEDMSSYTYWKCLYATTLCPATFEKPYMEINSQTTEFLDPMRNENQKLP